jgi:hypothetical protein
MGQKSSTPSRYRAPQLLLDKGIPCVIWAEDALAHHGVNTECFDLFLLVHNQMQAAECLAASGFIRVGSDGSYKHIPPLDEGVPRFVDPEYRQYYSFRDGNTESSVAVLSAKDWGYALPTDTVGLDAFPPLNALFDSLAHTWLGAPTAVVALHFLVHIGYLFEYVPAVRDPAFPQTLRPEHRPLYDSYVTTGLLGTERSQHRQRRDEILLQMDNFNHNTKG